MTTEILLFETQETVTTRKCLGAIRVTKDNRRFSLPLNAVQISARVVDRITHVTVTETFKNPYSEHLEAVYIFPLSGGSAVSSFEMKVGDRKIVGKVAERQAAREEYAEAIVAGKRTALMEQERDDVFTVQVGNLPPGEEVTVLITYSEKLPYFDNGTTELRLPLVVAPRYIPGSPVARDSVGDGTELDTDIVPDASRISPPRLAPGVDPKTALSLTVELAGDGVIEDLQCSQHATKTGISKDGVKVTLSREDELLDRDFVLRWRVATDELQSNLIVYRKPDSENEYFGMLSLVPPKCDTMTAPPRDVIFVVDRSGSMGGVKMVSAARACSLLIATLGPRDRFAIEAFDDSNEWMTVGSERFIFADESGKESGDKYLRTVTARGGTEMHRALTDAIQTMKGHRENKLRLPVIVVLTDGEVGNEGPILKHVQSELSDCRVFTIGVDTAVNQGFLTHLAAIGGGTATFVSPGAQLEDALSGVGREIGAPLIQDLTIEDVNCGLDKDSIAPARIGDLFEGRANAVLFSFDGAKLKELADARVRVQGKFKDGSSFAEEIKAKVVDIPAMAQLWAKSHIVDLEDQYRVAGSSNQDLLHRKIVDVAVKHSLLTRFTAFVVVDHAEIVNAGGDVRKLVQPVQTPALWEGAQSSPLVRPRIMARSKAPSPLQGWGASNTGSWDIPVGNSWGASPAVPRSTSYGSPPGAAMPSAPAGGSWGAAEHADRLASAASAADAAAASSTSSDCWGSPPAEAGGLAQPDANELPKPSAPAAAPTPNAAPSMAPAPRHEGKLSQKSFGANKAKNESFWIQTSEQASSVNEPTLPPSEATQAHLVAGYKQFERVLNQAFKDLRDGKLPDPDKIQAERLNLLSLLSRSKFAAKLPLLQKYLRGDVVRFLLFLHPNSDVNTALMEVQFQEDILKAIAKEAEIITAAKKPFWRLGV